MVEPGVVRCDVAARETSQTASQNLLLYKPSRGVKPPLRHPQFPLLGERVRVRGNLCNCRPIPLACLNFAAAFKDIGRNLERDGDYMQKLPDYC